MANGKKRLGIFTQVNDFFNVHILYYVCFSFSWIKFEEDVEDGGNRWTKPFVGTLSLHALFELRSSFLHGTLILDTPATTVFGVVNELADDMVITQNLNEHQKAKV